MASLGMVIQRESLIRMIQRRAIRRWCEGVAREFRPHKIILFGSYAQGTATESEVDMLVVMPLAQGQREVWRAAAIATVCVLAFPWMSSCARQTK
jgi:predicted nucleotidyltransferase